MRTPSRTTLDPRPERSGASARPPPPSACARSAQRCVASSPFRPPFQDPDYEITSGPVSGGQVTPANKLPCVQFSIDTNGKFTVVASKRPDQGPFLIGQSPDGGYDAFRSLAFKRVQVRIFDQLGRCESGSVDGCGCLRSQSPNRAEQMPRGKLPDTEAGRLTLPWPLGRRR